jgi:hypothetical protein
MDDLPKPPPRSWRWIPRFAFGVLGTLVAVVLILVLAIALLVLYVLVRGVTWQRHRA